MVLMSPHRPAHSTESKSETSSQINDITVHLWYQAFIACLGISIPRGEKKYIYICRKVSPDFQSSNLQNQLFVN
jgi:hypothetical protein